MFDRSLMVLVAIIFAMVALWWQIDQRDRCDRAGGNLVNGPFGYTCIKRLGH